MTDVELLFEDTVQDIRLDRLNLSNFLYRNYSWFKDDEIQSFFDFEDSVLNFEDLIVNSCDDEVITSLPPESPSQSQ